MGSVTSSGKGWKAAAARLAVVIAIVVPALGLEVGWPQEPAQPRLDEEFTKQEKIYRSRGAEVPSGYVTNRGLSDYAELLPSGFCDALGRLGSSDRWLDIGAGAGAGHTGLLCVRRRRGAGSKMRPVRGKGARSRDVHRGPPDRQVARPGRELRR